MGFEPTRAEHIGLAVQRLNHSATSSDNSQREKTSYQLILDTQIITDVSNEHLLRIIQMPGKTFFFPKQQEPSKNSDVNELTGSSSLIDYQFYFIKKTKTSLSMIDSFFSLSFQLQDRGQLPSERRIKERARKRSITKDIVSV